MKDTAIKYFTEELGEKNSRAEEMYLKLEKHPDILNEFGYYLTKREFPVENNGAVIIGGYSAKKLSETVGSKLTPIGIYNYLIYLREEPEEALSNLQKGLPVK